MSIPRRRAARALVGLALAALGAGGAAVAGVRVEVSGVSGEAARNVTLLLTLHQARNEGLTEEEVRRLYARAPAEIARALEPWGFYQVRVDSDLIRDGDTWVARFQVAPGQRVAVTQVRVALVGPGEEDAGFQDLVRRFPVRPGDPLFHPAYDEGKGLLAAFAAEHGYLDARFTTARLQVDAHRGEAEVHLEFETGPQFHLGPVTFHQDAVAEGVLAGYVPFRPGDPYANRALVELQDRLSVTGYFQRVEVLPRRDLAENGEVPVEVHAVTRRPWGWDVGAGYGTDTGPRGTVTLDGRRVNRRGHRGKAEALVSGIEQSLSARYLVPLPAWQDGLLALSAGWADQSPGTADTATFLVGASLGRARGRWRETAALSYQRETFTVGVDEGRSTLLIPSLAWTRLAADDPVLPRRGYRLDLRLRAGTSTVVSDTSFLQTLAEARVVRPLARRSRLLLRAAAGTTATESFRRLPPSVRFFAGGDASVRGFSYRSLGPVDQEGTVIGGERLAVAGIEVDTMVVDRWGGLGVAAFLDAGTAFSGRIPAPARGAGIGLRWVSPVGVLRLDVAWPLSVRHGSPRLHFSMGSDL